MKREGGMSGNMIDTWYLKLIFNDPSSYEMLIDRRLLEHRLAMAADEIDKRATAIKWFSKNNDRFIRARKSLRDAKQR